MQGRIEGFFFLRTVDADHLGAFTRQRGGDGGADAARGAGDQRGLAGQRLGEAAGHQALRRRDQRQHLAGDESGVAAEQEAQGAVDPGFGAVGHGEQVGGGTLAPDLLGQALDEAGEGAGCRRFRRAVAAGGRAADNDDARAGGQTFQVLVEEGIQRLQFSRSGSAGGVEHQQRRGGFGQGGAGAFQRGFDAVAIARLRHAADDGGLAGQRLRAVSLRLARQARRTGQIQRGEELAAQRGLRQFQVTVAHVCLPCLILWGSLRHGAAAARRKLCRYGVLPPWLYGQSCLSNSPVLRCGNRREIVAGTRTLRQHRLVAAAHAGGRNSNPFQKK